MKKLIWKIIVSIVVVFIVYNLISLFTVQEKSIIAELDTMEKSYKLDGIIIRNENQITTDIKDGGILDVAVSENEMVRKGKLVATYFDSNIDDETKSELARINERISELNNATDDTIAEEMSEKELDEEIERKTDDIAFASSDRSMAVVSSLKSEVNELISRKNSEKDDLTTVSERIEELKLQKAEIEKRYSGRKIEITAPEHGVFSTRIDGFEDVITPSASLNLTYSDYENAKNKNITADDIRQKGVLCKIVDNSIWYVSVVADKATAKSFAVGEKVTLRFEGESTVAKGTVEYISKEQSGKYMVTISSSSYCNYPMQNRFASLTIVKESHTGLKIPLSSVRIKDGKTGVYVKTENTMRYKEIEILCKDDTYAIAKFDNTRAGALLLYDEVIVNK